MTTRKELMELYELVEWLYDRLGCPKCATDWTEMEQWELGDRVEEMRAKYAGRRSGKDLK